MKRVKFESVIGSRRCKCSYLLLMFAVFYVTIIAYKFPALLEIASGFRTTNVNDNVNGGIIYGINDDLDVTKPAIISIYKDTIHRRFDHGIGSNDDKHGKSIPNVINFADELRVGSKPLKPLRHPYGRITGNASSLRNMSLDLSVLEKMADEAWTLGLMAWEELESFDVGDINVSSVFEGTPQMCSPWLSITGEELGKRDHVMSLPCGLSHGSSITVVGTPHYAHSEYVPQLARISRGNPLVNVSQFSIELQGLKSVDGEAPPKIMHLNPRLRGDWSRRSVIEHNSCYRMQWGRAQRCDGAASVKDVDVLIDGFRRCEKWVLSDVVGPRESRTISWFKRFIGRELKPEITWQFPFVEGKMFILTIRAGVEGYHISVGGRHVTSFPYRTGFTLEDATGLAVQGDVDIHSIYATSLPTSHPSFSPQRVLEMSVKWKAQPLPSKPIKLLIGVLSATNHFAERMAVRKTWMQSPEIKASIVSARFFVALNQRTEVNAVLKKEAAYFGDVVILPFLDRYELVVLKTIAICDYGVLNMKTAYIMKCDDDTFVRVDAVLKQIEDFRPEESLYLGNLNLMHRPLRYGKWAVTFEEWPESVYPPYANGPGYVISRDIAKFIVNEHINKRLRLFKMEDVSMGMWVQQFNSSRQVEYSHSWKFCQYGCVEGYYTAHYQSPRQMLCLWDKLARCCPHCCNFR